MKCVKLNCGGNHNHSVNSFHLQSFCPILLSTKDTFEKYFQSGMSASEAFHHHETNLMQDCFNNAASRQKVMSVTY